jgi:hypothetical protein
MQGGDGMKKYQIVWHRTFSIGFKRLRSKDTSLSLIYAWVLWFGFVEVRRWTDHILRLKERS